MDRTGAHLAGIDDASIPVRSMSIPGIPGVLEARILSTDLRGSSTRLIRLRPDWGSEESGAFTAAVELFVFRGALQIGDHALATGDYVHIPENRVVPGLRTTGEGGALLMTSGPVRYDQSFSGKPADLTPGRASDQDWEPVPEMPGRFMKRLGQGPVGDVWLGGAHQWDHGDGGWHCHPHHEECFVIDGEITLRERREEPDQPVTAGPGTYFFRPAGVWHGGPGSRCEDTALTFHRAFGDLHTDWDHAGPTETGAAETG
jgi:mannose-6-phosphate isomerase-like protein (cupin superfamily)